MGYIEEGWWHPNCNSGRVHDHPERPGRNWSAPAHRSCRQVFTRVQTPPPAARLIQVGWRNRQTGEPCVCPSSELSPHQNHDPIFITTGAATLPEISAAAEQLS